jgi:hypothetical protein
MTPAAILAGIPADLLRRHADPTERANHAT